MVSGYKSLRFVASGTVVLIVIFAALWSLNAPPSVNSEPKPPWPTFQPEAKATLMALERQRDLERVAREGYKTVGPGPVPTPVETPLPPGVKPDWADLVKSIPLKDIADYPPLRYATSIWVNGSVSYQDRQGKIHWSPLFVYAVPDESDNVPFIRIALGDAPEALARQYETEWVAPRALGPLVITNIEGGPRGVLSFTSGSGQAGTLNMATGEWSFTP